VCASFVEQWDAHGNELSASFDLRYNKFLILGVNEQQAGVSGCSIDKSVALVKELGNRYGVDFLNRTLIAWKEEGALKQTPMHEFWAMRKAGLITAKTDVFNNLVKTKEELDANWETQFESSWHNEMW
jgi:hypothetical protein